MADFVSEYGFISSVGSPSSKGFMPEGSTTITPILDTYPAVAAYSTFRQLRTGATLCVRVRRDSDDAELDIGFMSGFLDAAALLAFSAGTSAYIVNIYNQSGVTGYDLEQTVMGDQMQIVSSGSLVTLTNGQAAADTNNLLRHALMESSGLDLFRNLQYSQTFITFQAASGSQSNTNIFRATTGGTGSGARFTFLTSTVDATKLRTVTRSPDSTSNIGDVNGSINYGTNPVVASGRAKYSDGELYLRQDGVDAGSDLTANVSNTTDGDSVTIRFGPRQGTPFDGLLAEMIVYTDNTFEGNISDIEDNMMEAIQ